MSTTAPRTSAVRTGTTAVSATAASATAVRATAVRATVVRATGRSVQALPASLRTVRTVLLAATLGLAILLISAAVHPASASAATYTKSALAKQYASSMLSLLNQERAAHNLRPLAMEAHLLTSAYNHNTRQAAQNTMSHQLPGEPYFATRISNTGYHWSTVGENVAWNSDRTLAGVQYLQRSMYNEVAPNNGHRLNILSTQFTQIGIDVYFDNTHNKIWITQDFGRPTS
jgi:uncharacterized protein YkwD